MKANVSPKLKKSLTYSAVILFILTVFLLGYFFYFIPKNKQVIHNNGFLILKTIAANIQAKTEGRSTLYNNFYKNAYSSRSRNGVRSKTQVIDTISKLLTENKITATFKFVPLAAKEGIPDQIIEPNKNTDSLIKSFCIENENFVFSIKKEDRPDSLVFYEPVADFLQPILVTQKDELFQFYALSKIVGKQSNLLYNDPNFGMRSDIPIDSLLPKNAMAYLNGIQNITSREFNHKMFYYPFNISGIQMQMYGFVRSDEYNSALQRVPFTFVYPLAIAFLILLFFLPILKFYIMDSNEQVKVIDVTLFGLSVFMGSSLVTLVIIQLLLWVGEEERVKENLHTLSSQISTSFITELNAIYNQLDRLHTQTEQDSATLEERRKEETNIDYSETIRNKIRSQAIQRDPSVYYYFDRISWVDNRGNQVIKAEMDGKPVFTNVRDRKYFQVFKNNDPLVLYNNNDTAKKLGWEPIYSWTNGDFNISISKRSGEWIEAMATQMHSVVKTLLPAGYGFCIIDKDGNVQVHSDVKRNLRENFFEKADPSTDIQGVIAARQDTSLTDVVMYGKWHVMNVSPLANLPYTIVTFYDKGGLFPVNMRILIFTLLFCILFAVICTILWLSLSRTSFKNHPLVYCPMDCLSWLTPQRKDATYYLHGCVFLSVYTLLLVVFAARYNSYSISNYTIFSIVLLTPVNVVFVLLSLRVYYLKNQAGTGDTETNSTSHLLKKIFFKWKFPLIHLAITAIYFLIGKTKDYPIGWSFLSFQLVFIAWAFLDRLTHEVAGIRSKLRSLRNTIIPMFYSSKTSAETTDENEVSYKSYLRRFHVLVTFLIVCLAVLPGALFTWYAYNQELIQTVKRQQLHLANDIETRSNEILSRIGRRDTLIPPSYLSDLLYKKGIYTVDNVDFITPQIDTAFDAKTKTFRDGKLGHPHPKRAYEDFYFSIAGAVSYPYYDSKNYPPLKDFSADSNWRWEKSKSTLDFWYYKRLPFPGVEAEAKALHFSFFLPDHFRLLKWQWLWFALFIAGFIIGLYIWLKATLNNIFLLKYVKEATPDTNTKTGLIAQYYDQPEQSSNQISAHVNATNILSQPNKNVQDFPAHYSSCNYPKYTTTVNRLKLNGYEQELLKMIREAQGLYEYVWSHCSEKEKYLLFDFANDGLINYKNPREIFNLLHNGVFIVDADYKLRLFSPGFRAFLLTKNEDIEIVDMRRKFHQNSTWQALHGPLLLLLLGFAGVIFFTQEAVFQKFIAIAGGLGTLISLIPKFLSVGGSKAPDNKDK